MLCLSSTHKPQCWMKDCGLALACKDGKSYCLTVLSNSLPDNQGENFESSRIQTGTKAPLLLYLKLEHIAMLYAPCNKTKMPRGTQSDILEGCCFLAGIIFSWFRQSFRQIQTLTRNIHQERAILPFGEERVSWAEPSTMFTGGQGGGHPPLMA